MTTKSIENNQPLAVCLHTSASSGRQWQELAATLEGRIRTITPDLVGYGKGDRYRRGSRFHLDQEVQNVLRQIKAETGKDNGPLHLVGHSYGAAVALQIALTYPERVASLTLYEPAQFLLLFADGLNSPEGREILALRKFMHENMKSPIGRWSVAKKYIDYWSGEGSWSKMSFLRQRALVSLMPKVAAEFEAILSANVSAADFADLDMPVRLILGSETHATARKVTEVLNAVLPNVELVTVDGAEHMAPATQADNINPLFAGHVVATMERQYSIAA
jgi:pimeloyl-ACP methyl ester carboxylesterase